MPKISEEVTGIGKNKAHAVTWAEQLTIINQFKIMENTLETKNALVNLEELTANQLPELQGWKETQLKIVEENPFVKIEDNKTYEDAKKARTALVSARTTIEKQEKTIASKLRDFRNKVGEASKELILITQPHEEKQQDEVKRYEAEKEAERLERERLEKERKDSIQKEAVDFYEGWKKNISEIQFSELGVLEREINEAIEDASKSDWEEFELDFIEKTRLLKSQFEERKAYLIRQEEQRKESERLEKERAELEEKRRKESERREALKPYLMFIRDFDKVMQLPDKDFKAELKTLEAVQADYLESERKKAEEQARKEIEAENKAKADAEQLRKEREELEKQRQKVEAEKRAHEEKLANEREEKERAEKEEKAKAEKLEAEKRAEELKPEKEKLESYIDKIRPPETIPDLKQESAIKFLGEAIIKVEELRENLLDELKNI